MPGRNVLSELSPYLRLHPALFVGIVVVGVLSSLAEGIGVSLFIPLLNEFGNTATDATSGNWFAEFLKSLFNDVPDDSRFLVVSICILAAIVVKASLSFGTQILYGLLDARLGHHLRSNIFRQLLTISYDSWENSASDRTFNTLAGETWKTSKAVATVVFVIISSVTLVIYTTILFLISWRLTILVGLVLVAILFSSRLFTRSAESMGRLATRANVRLTNRMMQSFQGMKIIRSYGQEFFEQDRFDAASSRVSNIFFRLGVVTGLVNPVHELLAATLIVALLITAPLHVENLPALLVFIFILYRLQPKIKALDGAVVALESLTVPVREVTRLLSPADKIYVPSGEKPFSKLRNDIRFHDVSFKYKSSSESALEHINVTVPAGKVVAVAGPSGAGKSTFIRLLLRLDDPQHGQILIDDVPLTELNLQDWRNKISLVSQEVFLFDTTVYENIAYGSSDITEAEVLDAATRAGAHDFISALPSGYHTRVGDRGTRLSGGQKQRISLARAFVRKPELLILDEATNALDSIAERIVQDALDALQGLCTIVVIAHRLSTIKNADSIILLDEGKVRAVGKFDYLIKNDDMFAQLHKLQFDDEIFRVRR